MLLSSVWHAPGKIQASRTCLSAQGLRSLELDHDKTQIDDALGIAVAAAGFWFQLAHGFMLPFPLSIIFLPLTIVEWILKWQIVMG